MRKVLTVIGFIFTMVTAAGQQWISIGPCGSDTYGNKIAPQGGTGQIHCIVFDPDSQNIVYAGSPFGGLWKSTDGGHNWTDSDIDVDQNLEFSSVSDIAITKTGNTKFLWIATGHPSGRGEAMLHTFEPFSSGLYVSVNGGTNFKPVTSFNKKHGFLFANKKHITRIVANPVRQEIMFVATSDGLYQTTDAGKNWKLVLTGKTPDESDQYPAKRNSKDVEINPAIFMDNEDEAGESEHAGAAIFSVAFSPTDPDNVVYASGTDIYKSVKGGKRGSFKSMTHNLSDLLTDPPGCLKSLTMNMALNIRAGKDVMYVSAFIVGDTCGEYRQRKDYNIFYFDGKVWNRKTSPSLSIPDGIRLKMATVPGNPNMLYAGTATVSLSEDFGATWKQVIDYNQPGHADVHAIENIPGTNDILAGTDGGIFRYTYHVKKVDEYNNGLCLGQVIDMGCSATNPNRIIIGLQDEGADIWDGKEWTKLPASGDGYYGQLMDYSNDMDFFSCHNNTFFKNGSDTRIVLSGCNVCGKGCPFSFAQDPKRPNIFYFGEKDIYKSVDTGKTWCRISDFKSKGFYLNPFGHIIYDIEISPTNPDVVFAAFNGMSTCCTTQLLKTTTGGSPCNGSCSSPRGDDWTLINIPKTETGDGAKDFIENGLHSITTIAICDNNSDKFWLGFSFYNLDDPSYQVYKTEDNGATWQKDDNGLPAYPVTKLLYVAGSDDELYAGTWSGVYHKKGTGRWEKFGTGLPHVYVSDMEINYPAHELRVSTFGRGVWKIKLP